MAVAVPDKIRLYLSGGSNRSSLGSIGAIMFLVMNDPQGVCHWRDVDEVIGVSGGSQPIAAMMIGLERKAPDPAAQAALPVGLLAPDFDDYAHTIQSLRQLYQGVAYSGDHWRKPGRRRRLVLTIIVLALLPLVLGAFFWTFGSIGWVPSLWPASWPTTFVAFAVGVLVIPFVYRIGARLVHNYLRDVIASFFTSGKNPPSLDDLTDDGKARKPERSYFIGTAGLATGNNYFYWAGQGFGNNRPDRVSRSAATPVQAVVASSSLPPLSRRGSPPLKEVNLSWDHSLTPATGTPISPPLHLPADAPDTESLLDGGYGGTFGQQLTQRVLEDVHQGGTLTNRRIIALDAGRRLQPPKLPVRWAREISTVLRLLRIIEVGNKATYTNDIQDLEEVNGSVVAVATTGVDEPFPQAKTDRDQIENGLHGAIEANGTLGLTNLDPGKAALGVAVGVVGMYLAELKCRDAVNKAPVAASHKALDQLLKDVGTALDVKNELLDQWKGHL